LATEREEKNILEEQLSSLEVRLNLMHLKRSCILYKLLNLLRFFDSAFSQGNLRKEISKLEEEVNKVGDNMTSSNSISICHRIHGNP
jgi:hypothetical protein